MGCCWNWEIIKKPRSSIAKYLIKYINKDYGEIREIDFNKIIKTSKYKRIALIHLAWLG